MHNDHDFDLHDKREMNKFGLETYFLNTTNMYDIAINKLIEDIKNNILQSKRELNKLIELKKKHSQLYGGSAEGDRDNFDN